MRASVSAWCVRALAAGLLLAVAGQANAVNGNASGNGVMHARVCPGPAAHGNARCHAHVVVDGRGRPLASGGPSGLNPADLRDAYKLSGTDTGASTTIIAIVDAYGYANAESDLATYRSRFGLPPCTTANGCFRKLNQNGVQGSYPREDTGWAQESALDLDMASAMCPGCKLILVEATTPSYANLAAAVNTAVAKGATVVSNSYGGGESGSSGYESAYNHPGVAVTASTGDNGYGVSFPASSPNVIAVGGTHLVRAANARGWTETVWSGAGSGCSAIYVKPSWQKDTGCSRRALADVSAVADPATGVSVYGPASRKGSAWLVFGGTSVGAPLIGGVYAVKNGTQGFAYDLYQPGASLYDVTSGSNGSCGGSYLCTAGVGYDGPTGMGTPNTPAAFGH